MGKNIILREMTGRYPQLSTVEDEIGKAADCLIACYRQGGKVLICGNGGSSSDSGHIVGELMKGFENKRPLSEDLQRSLIVAHGERGKYLAENLQQGLPAISLADQSALVTATANDIDADLIYAQQVAGYGNKGDILISISTSGNAQNVIDAAMMARAKEMSVIGLTGESGGKLKTFCDILVNVPESRTSYVQELLMPVYHAICLIVETEFFGSQH